MSLVAFHHKVYRLLNLCPSIRRLKQIHGCILTNGLSRDLLLLTKLISLASSLGSTMEYANAVFETISDPDAFVCNTLIRGYVNLGPCQSALYIYKKMHFLGLLPDNFTFPFVIRSCAVLSALKEGKQVHCNVIKNGIDLDVYVQSSLVSMYAQNGEISSSDLIFQGIKAQNVVSWTSMIAGYTQNGFPKEALCVFKRMASSCVKPNSVTLVTVLPAVAGLELLKTGEVIHGYAIKSGVDHDVSLTNSLISMYGKCKSIDVARNLFERMKTRNLVSWNTIIAAYVQNKSGREARKLFRRMQTENVKFDCITMVSIISSCTCLGDLKEGKWVHDLVTKEGMETNCSVANALIDMYAKCGCLDVATYLFHKLPERSVVSWSAMIGGYAAHGHAKDALDIFASMLEEGIQPNKLTVTSLLTACRHSGHFEEGIELYNCMVRDYSMVPNLEHCACLVDLLGRAGRLVEAFDFVMNMPVKPDAGVWGALLSACRTHGNVELAEIVAGRLFEMEPHTVTYYVLLTNIYAEAGKWDDVMKLKKLMNEKELKKIPGNSLI